MNALLTFVKKQLPFYLLIVAGFYLLPLVIFDYGSAVTLIAVLFPLLAFCSGIGFAVLYKYRWEFCIVVGLLFLPTVFIYYNMSMWIYCVVYGVLALIGNGLGEYIKFSNKQKN